MVDSVHSIVKLWSGSCLYFAIINGFFFLAVWLGVGLSCWRRFPVFGVVAWSFYNAEVGCVVASIVFGCFLHGSSWRLICVIWDWFSGFVFLCLC